MAYLPDTPKTRGKVAPAREVGHCPGDGTNRTAGFKHLKTAITVIAEIVRSLVLSGLAAALLALAIGAASATTGYCLWRLWQKSRR
jgi:hypothetical protein